MRLGAMRGGLLEVVFVTVPGLEEVVLSECRALGIKRILRREKGAVTARVTTRQLYAANALMRSATRVLLSAFRFHASSFPELERRLHALDWSPWLDERSRPQLRVSSVRSALYHERAIAERFARLMPTEPSIDAAPPDAPTAAPAPGGPLIVVRATRDVFEVRIDSSGEALHRRGYRTMIGEAPLRETIAAGMLSASGWDPATPLVDPCGGSGTLVCEAALLAIGAPPHGSANPRRFALHEWPCFEPGTWGSVSAEVERMGAEAAAAAKAAAQRPPAIFMGEADASAVRAARENARRAGVEHLVDFRTAEIAEIAEIASASAAPVGHVISNLPWGRRSSAAGGGGLRALCTSLGRACATRLAGYRLAALVADRRLARPLGAGLARAAAGGAPRLRSALSLEVGGQRAWLLAT